jgi:hypothetical protein
MARPTVLRMSTKKEKDERRKTLRPHPARDVIIGVMRSYGKPISPAQIARVTGFTLGSTAYHVRTLVTSGIVELADEGRVRGAVEHFYSLVPTALDDTSMNDPVRATLALCEALTVPDPEGGPPRRTRVDETARAEITGLLTDLRPKVQAIAFAATARAVATGHK